MFKVKLHRSTEKAPSPESQRAPPASEAKLFENDVVCKTTDGELTEVIAAPVAATFPVKTEAESASPMFWRVTAPKEIPVFCEKEQLVTVSV